MTPPEKTIRRESLVLRVLWMLLFLLVWQIAVPLLGILIVAQLLYRLFYGAPSSHFMSFGDSLSQYLTQIGSFAVFNTDAKPWPVADWPVARVADGEAAHIPKAKLAEEDVDVAVASVKEPVEPVEPVDTVEASAETPAAKPAVEAPAVSEVEKLAQDTALEVETNDKPTSVTKPSDETKP